MKFEILAPAGSGESLIAGVRSGANGIYLGGKSFNARRNAGNFDDIQLEKAVAYCHGRNVKVYQALNILVADREMKSVYQTVYSSLAAGVDAFIVQDIGLARIIKNCFPEARLHGSTQMSILTPSGAEFARENGFSRIVLPREMSLDEIKEIRKSTDLELEMFVHGALCMSVSGQCYMSSVIGARSGNRGLCAQPCRLPFTACGDKTEHALSLKDLSLTEHLAELDGIVDSLKIEGRMKRPEYVAAAVTAVKNAVNGKPNVEDKHLLKSVFSRSGFTDGYFTSHRGDGMFGIRRYEDVAAAQGVLSQIENSYKNEKPLVPADMRFVCKTGEKCSLTVSALGKTAAAECEPPEIAVNKPTTADMIKQRLSKLGGTQFYARNIEIKLDDGLVLPASKINALRRSAIEKIDVYEKRTPTALPLSLPQKSAKNGAKFTCASFVSARQIPDSHPFDYVFIPLDSKIEDFAETGAGVILPRAPFGEEKCIEKRLNELKTAGVKNALCGNIGLYRLAEEAGFCVFGDFGLNIFNSVSAGMIKNPTLSFELSLAQANGICAENTGVIVYGRLPLMLTRNCPVKSSIGCARCKKSGVLTDRTGSKFRVLCSAYPCVEILNSVPLYMLDRLDEIKTDFIRFVFTTESAAEVRRVAELYKNKSKPDFKYTRGLYTRGVL